jgi:hypothetical protein
MLRRVLSFATGAALLCGGLFTTPAQAQTLINTTNYTISCDTLSKGVVQFKPSLVLGGTSPETTMIKGTLTGCTATPPAGGDAVTVISGSVLGVLSTPTNDCGALLGSSQATGQLVIKWKTVQKLENATTTITIGSGNVTGGLAAPFSPDTAQYGLFTISGTTQTGAFGGASGNGTGSFTKSITTQGFTALGAACSPPSLGLKVINLGSTEVGLQ